MNRALEIGAGLLRIAGSKIGEYNIIAKTTITPPQRLCLRFLSFEAPDLKI